MATKDRPSWLAPVLLLALLSMSGCQTAWSWPGRIFARRTASTVEGMARRSAPQEGAALTAANANGTATADDSPAESAVVQASTPAPGGSSQNPADEVFAELQRVAEIDPAAQQHLLRELQTVDEEDRPLVARNFRSALEYREQLRADSAGSPGGMNGQRVQTADLRSAQPWPATSGDGSQQPPAAMPPAGALPPASGTESGQPATPPESSSPFGGLLDPRRVRADGEAGPLLAGRSPQTEFGDPAAGKLGPLPGAVQQAVYEQTASSATGTAVSPASHTNEAPSGAMSGDPTVDWRDHLQLAIAQMNAGGSDFPESTDAVRELFRLRMLQLAAGNNEEAVRPVAGASPPEQDFWSKGMFALSAFLNENPQLNDEQRASAAALHLGSALESLGELSKLTLSNLAYCTAVHGFGAYEPRDSNRFRPGDEVLLYVEVNHYHSRQTSSGFFTSLGGSYELVDAEGQHVDSHQFPVVEDTCRSRRRDFHIKYGLVLPEDLPPGSYQLQIVMRDNLNQRIGRSSIALEVVAK